ncbi:acetyl-CoA synthetase-like protein, partial [Conidiobolus coronatus NRRL 28638]
MSAVKYSKTGRFIDLVKENAENGKNIQHPAITINPCGKHIDISFEEYYNVVCHSANYFYDKLNSLNFANSRNVGFLSMSDSHYLWNVLGLMSINAAPVMLSPRNSFEATIQLLKESNAQALVYQEYFEGFAKKVKEYMPELVLIPKWIAEFPECLSPQEHKLLVPLESQEKELENVAYILHSSGSTAHPKLIAQPNRVCHNSAHRTRVEAAPYNNKEISFLPLFHAGGIVSFVVISIYLAKAIIMVPDLAIGSHFSSKMILDMIQELRPTHLMILPLMVKELVEYCDQVEKSQGWDIFKIVKVVRYGGAQLPRVMISALFDNGICPQSSYGSTECSVLLKCIPDRNSEHLTVLTPIDELRYKLKDWGESVYELIILGDDPCLARVRDEDKDEEGNFPTKDLFQVLSHEPLLLNYLSRADDTIIHVNGEKTNPLPMEDKINRCPYIDRCAILGTGQQMNTLLVQLNVKEVMASSLSEVLSSIKSFIKLANDSAPSHSRIYEEMIYYLPMGSEKKLPGTMKGNLQRNLCAKMFKEEVKKTVEKM